MFVAKNYMPALALLVVALLGAPQAAQGLNPRPFEAHFALEVQGFTLGETVWRVQRVDGGFIYETRTKATGIAAVFGAKQVVERSEWRRIDGDIKPASYRYERSGRPDKTTAVVFDWNDGIVRNTRRGRTSRMSVPVDTLDKLGYMLVLMEDLRAGKRSVRYHIADGKNRMKVYELKVVGTERMETALGTFDVLKIVREHDDDDRDTTIWVAPALDYMPVRIEHREREDEDLTVTIRSLSSDSMTRVPDTDDADAPGRSRPAPDDKR